MARLAVLALAISAFAAGCSRQEIPVDLTQESLRQLRSGEYDEAIKTASEAISQKPDSAAAYLYRGRAYHYRNAMGDHQRAIGDFSEAIRLAPDSSDAYYSRALARRDLGQTELAAADETKARELDEVVQDTYRRMPDLTPSTEPTGPPVAKPAASELSGSDEEQKKVYDKLKGRFEPGFGELRTPASRSGDASAAKSGASLNDRYRDLLEQANRAEAEKAAAAAPLAGQDPMPTPGSGATSPSASESPAAAESGAAATAPRGRGNTRAGGAWQGPLQPPPLTSPFSQRPSVNPGGQMDPTVNRNLQSPFQQITPGGTGFTPPQTPFGAQSRQPTASPVTRPFGGSTTNRFSNPNVRPANPRDFVP